MDYLNKSRIEEVLIAILGKGMVTSRLLSRIEKILDAIRVKGSYDGIAMSEVEEILVCILLGKRFEKPTHSRIAAMLKVKANGGEYTELRKSRVEELIFEWINAVESATYIGTLPATLQTVKGYLESYKIYGNAVQDGTPTPENPIVPSGCGELETTGVHAGQYKIPLLSGSTPVDIYLGESQTTRRIKKLVLTGEEGWVRTQNQRCYYIDTFTGCPTDYLKQTITTSICSHYQSQNNTASGSNEVEAGHFCFYTGGGFELYIGETTISSAADFKTYLQQQYANGTPVTIWYILATEQIGTLNEPLRKIGDYADTIDSTQTSVQIPTAAGTTVIDYNGTPKPDKVELTYSKPK